MKGVGIDPSLYRLIGSELCGRSSVPMAVDRRRLRFLREPNSLFYTRSRLLASSRLLTGYRSYSMTEGSNAEALKYVEIVVLRIVYKIGVATNSGY